jgi:glycosyltransferase involved in cell wall biosynthesis
MALVRVYLGTYRRNNLLPRALNSLLNQTFSDWVCELHNDDPTDKFPEELVRRTGDPRVSLVNHEVNYGPTRSFNGFFKPIGEPFFSVLEDDNWWEPQLLERLVAEMQAHPEASLAWGNQRFWREEPGGSWTDTGRDIWDRPEGAVPEVFEWPQPRHLFGALHSVGSMLARSATVQGSMVPLTTDFAATEGYRERMYPFPILFVPERLGNFALTVGTARSADLALETVSQALLAGSLFACTNPTDQELRQAWDQVSGPLRKRGSHVLFYSAFFFPECRRLLRFAGLSDWLFFLAYTVRHPQRAWRTCRLHKERQNEKEFLLQHTRARAEQSNRRKMPKAEDQHTPVGNAKFGGPGYR